MLLPKLVREKFPEMPIGFFLHIPFPSWEIFRMLPRAWREEIIEGLLGASLIGFHTHDYVRYFLTSVLRTAGYEHQLGSLTLRDRVVKVDTFPMGVEFERFRAGRGLEGNGVARGGIAGEMRRAKGDFFRGPAGLHQGADQPAARLRIVFEEQSAVARQGGVHHFRRAVAHRRGQLPGDETGTGADGGPHRRAISATCIGRRWSISFAI